MSHSPSSCERHGPNTARDHGGTLAVAVSVFAVVVFGVEACAVWAYYVESSFRTVSAVWVRDFWAVALGANLILLGLLEGATSPLWRRWRQRAVSQVSGPSGGPR